MLSESITYLYASLDNLIKITQVSRLTTVMMAAGGGGLCYLPLLDGNIGIDWTFGGQGTQVPPPPVEGCKKSYSGCVVRCMKEFSFYSVVKEIGGETAAGFTVGGTIASVANVGLNQTSAGSKPRGGLGGASRAGDPTTWQHRAFGWLGRQTGQPWIGRAGKLFGRIAGPVATGLLVFEGAYTAGTAASCGAICADCRNR